MSRNPFYVHRTLENQHSVVLLWVQSYTKRSFGELWTKWRGRGIMGGSYGPVEVQMFWDLLLPGAVYM